MKRLHWIMPVAVAAFTSLLASCSPSNLAGPARQETGTTVSAPLPTAASGTARDTTTPSASASAPTENPATSVAHLNVDNGCSLFSDAEARKLVGGGKKIAITSSSWVAGDGNSYPAIGCSYRAPKLTDPDPSAASFLYFDITNTPYSWNKMWGLFDKVSHGRGKSIDVPGFRKARYVHNAIDLSQYGIETTLIWAEVGNVLYSVDVGGRKSGGPGLAEAKQLLLAISR